MSSQVGAGAEVKAPARKRDIRFSQLRSGSRICAARSSRLTTLAVGVAR
jgi:hypothetical protein